LIAFSIALVVDIIMEFVRPKTLEILKEKYGKNSRIKFLGYGLLASLIPFVRWIYVAMVVGGALTSLFMNEEKLREKLKLEPKKHDVVSEQ